MGVYAEGPITDPKDLGPAILRAIAVVKRGEPALVEVGHATPLIFFSTAVARLLMTYSVILSEAKNLSSI